MGRKLQYLGLGAATILCTTIFVGSFFAGDFVREEVHDQILDSTLVQPKEGDTWTSVVNPDIVAPTYLHVSLFNLTNHVSVLKGAKAIVEEIGPFVYRQNTTIENVRYLNMEDSVSNLRKESYFFVPDASIGNPEEMQIIGPNIGLISVLKMLQTLPIPKVVSETLIKVVDSTPLFASRSVDEVIFGFQDPLLSRLKRIGGVLNMSLLKDIDPHIGIVKNNTAYDTIKMRAGLIDPFSLGDFLEFDGKSSINQFPAHPDLKIKGTDSYRFAPFIKPDDSLKMFVSDLKKNFELQRLTSAVQLQWPFSFSSNLNNKSSSQKKNFKKNISFLSSNAAQLQESTQNTMPGGSFTPLSPSEIRKQNKYKPSRPLDPKKIGQEWRVYVDKKNENTPHPFQDFGGVQTVVFTPSKSSFGSADPDFNNYFNEYGSQNVSALYQGAPLFVSKPHFLDSHPSYLAGVDGLNPSREKHEGYFWVEPFSGTCVGARFSMQVNMHIDLTTQSQKDHGKYVEPYYHPLGIVGKVANATESIMQSAAQVMPTIELSFKIDDWAPWVRIGVVALEIVVIVIFVWKRFIVPERQKRQIAAHQLTQLMDEENQMSMPMLDVLSEREYITNKENQMMMIPGKQDDIDVRSEVASMRRHSLFVIDQANKNSLEIPQNENRIEELKREINPISIPVASKDDFSPENLKKLELSGYTTMAPTSTLPLHNSSLEHSVLPLQQSYFYPSSDTNDKQSMKEDKEREHEDD